MPPAPVVVTTPVKATTSRKFEADPASGGSCQPDGGVDEKSREKRGHSPRSNVLLDQMEECKKVPRRERRPGLE